MSHGDGPPPIFEGDDFPYWKIRMEAYLEALDVGILRAASQGTFEGMQRLETPYLAKARNTIFRSSTRVTSSSMARKRSSSQALEGSQSLRWIATIVENLVI